MQKELNVPIYEATVFLAVNNDIKASIRSLNTLYDINEKIVDCKGLVNCCFSKKVGTTVFYMLINTGVDKKDYMNSIGHELQHLTQEILEHRQIYFKKGDPNEAYAYLQGYLLAENYEFWDKAYNKFKIKIKKTAG